MRPAIAARNASRGWLTDPWWQEHKRPLFDLDAGADELFRCALRAVLVSERQEVIVAFVQLCAREGI